MKVIISHDVDHLFRDDHYKDLIYPKLWVRESLNYIKRNITVAEWKGRMVSPFQKKRNRIEEIIAYDKAHNVPSSFFFGMAKGLGMSYEPEKAVPLIKLVCENGLEAGVHGIDFSNFEKIKNEYNTFSTLSGHSPVGVRMHYVRYDNETFSKLSECGYLFDSTEFDKTIGCCIKAPYKIGRLWEFPLTIMDGYLPYSFKKSKERTLELLDAAQRENTGYVTILFHDLYYSDAWVQRKRWYEWLIEYLLASSDYSFISFIDAIRELEGSIG
jgi:hypothetical protein